MDGHSSGIGIKKLSDASAFHTWKARIKLVLDLKGLGSVLCDKSPAYDSVEYIKWSENDRKAKAYIGLSLSDDYLEHVSGCDTASEMWQTITNIFERHTLFNKLAARRKFYTATMIESESILTYVTRIRQFADTLKSMGVDIDDKEMAMAVLNGLPDRFDNLISALDALGNEDSAFCLEFVKSRLLQEEQRMKSRSDAATLKSEASALLTARRNSQSYQQKCNHCGKVNHTDDRCYIKHPELAPPYWEHIRNKNQIAAAHAAITANIVPEEEHNDCSLVSNTQSRHMVQNKRPWLIDSGSTSHITFDRSAFSTYATQSSRTVEMGTKQIAHIAGIGTVDLPVIVNNKRYTIRLHDVLHVPDFAHQLISVSQMGTRGASATFKDSKCIIRKGTLTVATGTLHASLYHLDVAHSVSPRETGFLTSMQLWHERLAHVATAEAYGKSVRDDVIKGIT